MQRSPQFSRSNHYFANKTTVIPLSLILSGTCFYRVDLEERIRSREKREGWGSEAGQPRSAWNSSGSSRTRDDRPRPQPAREAFARTPQAGSGNLGKGAGKGCREAGGGALGGRAYGGVGGRGPRLGGGATGGVQPSFSAARATSPSASVWGEPAGEGTRRAGRELLAPLARVGGGRGGGGGVSVRAAWGRGGEAAAAAAASELRHTGPGRREPERSAGSWRRRRRR